MLTDKNQEQAIESESGENVECFWMLGKPLLVRFCFVVWVLFAAFSIFCMTSFGVCTPQHQETTKIFFCLTRQKKRIRITQLFFVTDLEKKSVQQRIKEIIW